MARRRICFDGNELGLDVTDLEAARGRPRLRLERGCRLFSEMGSGVAMVAGDAVDRGFAGYSPGLSISANCRARGIGQWRPAQMGSGPPR